ncbi:MAG: DUF7471 family protein [Methanobacteriota archaeon]
MVHYTDIAVGFSALSGLISAGLLVLAFAGWRRTRDRRLAFVAAAFTIFAAKSFVVAYSTLSGFLEHSEVEFVDAVADLATVLLLVTPLFLPQRFE